MANIDGIDTSVSSGLASRASTRIGGPGGDRSSSSLTGPPRARTPEPDRVELSGSALEAAQGPPVREDLVERVRAEIADDPDDYINRTLNEKIDVIIDRIARDLLT